ncbi:hypothetical protein SAY86_011516 [Trapa natans]|uniref:Endoplasmic reticulum transmembrane protein n=1 Tax=Trapa natans TaxID=22666 RepID=A0AAN7R6I5_TRANT|nr:hypothetical protein SAY86_011516 [Trapa natans]
MIQLLFTLIFSEMALILALLFKTPLRKLLIMLLDMLKRGRGPIMVKSVAVTVLVVFLSSLYTTVEIQRRTTDAAAINPTDQVIMGWKMLETSLMGFLLFLALMMDRLHHYIRELRQLRKTMEATKQHNKGTDDRNAVSKEQLKALKEETASLRAKISGLESECGKKEENIKAAEAKAKAMKKQSEGLQIEYDRLLEDNQSLRSQLQSMGQALSSSDGKKDI